MRASITSAFKILYRKDSICFVPYSFINTIIFVINPYGLYSRFVGADSWIKIVLDRFAFLLLNK